MKPLQRFLWILKEIVKNMKIRNTEEYKDICENNLKFNMRKI